MANAISNWFEISSGEAFRGAWFLDDPVGENGVALDPRLFTAGVFAESPAPTYVPIYNPGTIASFSMGSFDMPVGQIKGVRQIKPGVMPL